VDKDHLHDITSYPLIILGFDPKIHTFISKLLLFYHSKMVFGRLVYPATISANINSLLNANDLANRSVGIGI
jgi:hypothetical protein